MQTRIVSVERRTQNTTKTEVDMSCEIRLWQEQVELSYLNRTEMNVITTGIAC